MQDTISNGYILSYIGLVAERVNYGAEYCTAKKPDPITCGVRDYNRVLNEYSIFQVLFMVVFSGVMISALDPDPEQNFQLLGDSGSGFGSSKKGIVTPKEVS